MSGLSLFVRNREIPRYTANHARGRSLYAMVPRFRRRRTGIAAADFSRIRNAKVGRFTVDRLMAILNRLGARVDVEVRVRRVEPIEQAVPI